FPSISHPSPESLRSWVADGEYFGSAASRRSLRALGRNADEILRDGFAHERRREVFLSQAEGLRSRQEVTAALRRAAVEFRTRGRVELGMNEYPGCLFGGLKLRFLHCWIACGLKPMAWPRDDSPPD